MTTNMEFCYGLNPIDAEKMRGHFVCVAFNPELRLPSVVGRLYNIDPSTGTIFLFNVKNEAKVNEQEVTPFRIIMKHAVSSVTANEEISSLTSSAAARSIELIDEKLQLNVIDILH